MRAFTLLESLLYLGLFGLLMTGVLSGISAITESAYRDQTRALLETEGNFLIQKISYDIQHAEIISEPSLAQATTSELDFSTTDNTTTKISLDDGSLIRTEDSESQPLSTNTVQISKLVFGADQDISTPGTPTTFQISLQIAATSSTGRLLTQDFSAITYQTP